MSLNLETATLIGEGEWVKDMAYRVYKQGPLYWAVIVYGKWDPHIDEESAIRIIEDEIYSYI
jgi:hypothetical protein